MGFYDSGDNTPYSSGPGPRWGPPLKADGNLTYLEFIDLVQRYWEDVHPDVPIVPAQPKTVAHDPTIVYGLELKKTHSSEPKPRYREEIIQDGDENIVIQGWRFQIIVSFTVVASDPRLAEEILEVFENWMFELQPAWKRLGVSELVYARRLPDSELNQGDEDMAKRAVTYMLTVEKLLRTPVSKINEIIVDARVWLANNRATPQQATPHNPVMTHIHDQYSSATPSQ